MCKILVVPGIKDSTRVASLAFIKKMATLMHSGSDNDGIGYAALTNEGDLFGERWHLPGEAFNARVNVEGDEKEFIESFGGFLTPENKKKYNYFGVGPSGLDSIAAIALHSRHATTGREFENVHPFVSEDGLTALIHNGVINNHEKLKKIRSTNDSETILHAYTDLKVYDDVNMMQELADVLRGYYACGVFSETSEGVNILDIFKETRSNLHAVKIKELDTVAFATSLGYLETACKDLGMNIVQTYKVKDEMIIRMNPFTGECLGWAGFNAPSAFSQNTGYHSDYDSDGGWQRWGGKPPVYPEKKDNVTDIKGGDSKSDTPSAEERDLEAANASATEARKFVHGLSDENLIASCNKYLLKHLERENATTVDVDALRRRLLGVHKVAKLEKILESLSNEKGPYGWEEIFDSETHLWYLRRRSA